MIEAAIRSRLLQDGGVRPLLGTDVERIYPLLLPQPAQLPAITYQRVSTVRESTHDGPDGLAQARIQIDAWARTYAAAKDLAEAVRCALDGWSGVLEDQVVQRVSIDGEQDLYEDALRAYRVSIDVLVWFEELRPRTV